LNNIFSLKNKVAIVTGAASGLGKAIAKGFHDYGANVVIADIDKNEADKTAKSLGADSLSVKVNIANEEQVMQLVKKVSKEFGKIDILVNNAGIGIPKRDGKPVPLVELSQPEWEKVMGVNLTGTFLCVRHVGRYMIHEKKGKIINIASMSGFVANKKLTGSGVYCVSKAGVIMLTKSLAEEWAEYNIHVNCISPGYMETQQNVKMRKNPTISQMQLNLIPFQRYGKPEEIVGAAILLASEASSYMTGSNIVIDGGYSIV